jgi:hypothetical protein
MLFYFDICKWLKYWFSARKLLNFYTPSLYYIIISLILFSFGYIELGFLFFEWTLNSIYYVAVGI